MLSTHHMSNISKLKSLMPVGFWHSFLSTNVHQGEGNNGNSRVYTGKMQRCDYGGGDLRVLGRPCYALLGGFISASYLKSQFTRWIHFSSDSRKFWAKGTLRGSHKWDSIQRGTQIKFRWKKRQVQVKIPELYEIIMWVIRSNIVMYVSGKPKKTVEEYPRVASS